MGNCLRGLLNTRSSSHHSHSNSRKHSSRMPLASPTQIQQSVGRSSNPEKMVRAIAAGGHRPIEKKTSSSSNHRILIRKTQSTGHPIPPLQMSIPPIASAPGTPETINAILKVSVRFSMVDAFIQFRPHPFKFEITAVQARRANEIVWANVKHEEVVAKFRLITIELEPFTKYQVRCLVRVTTRSGQRAVPITTPAASVETGKRREELPGYLAIRDFEKRIPNEVSFSKGDVLESVECHLAQGVPDQFAYVRNRRSQEVGLAPSVCLQQEDALSKPAQVRHQSYFYATADKRRAAIMLMRPSIANGVFLLRPSADTSAENCIALSVRSGVDNGVPTLAKFKVYYLSDGYGCFIYPTKTFEDIETLVNYYRTTPIQKDVILTHGFVPPDDPNHKPTIAEIQIPKSTIEYGEKLGNGRFGNVFRGRLKHLDVAIKELILPDCEVSGDSLSPEVILEEALVMAGLFHDNIVKLIAVCVDSLPYCLISEYMNGGSLKKYIHTPEIRRTMEVNNVLYILLQISSGMAYLEAKNFIHRDLRADNVLVHEEPGSSLEVKIADFGLSRIVPEGVYESTSRLLPIRWTAPEALTSLKFSLKSDVWSFGILAFELVTLGNSPYPSIRSNNDVQRAIQAGVIMTLEECQSTDSSLCPESLYAVIRSCWQFEPEKRTDFSNLKSTFERFEESVEGQYLQ